jgi:hypothetical protein
MNFNRFDLTGRTTVVFGGGGGLCDRGDYCG